MSIDEAKLRAWLHEAIVPNESLAKNLEATGPDGLDAKYVRGMVDAYHHVLRDGIEECRDAAPVSLETGDGPGTVIVDGKSVQAESAEGARALAASAAGGPGHGPAETGDGAASKEANDGDVLGWVALRDGWLEYNDIFKERGHAEKARDGLQRDYPASKVTVEAVRLAASPAPEGEPSGDHDGYTDDPHVGDEVWSDGAWRRVLHVTVDEHDGELHFKLDDPCDYTGTYAVRRAAAPEGDTARTITALLAGEAMEPTVVADVLLDEEIDPAIFNGETFTIRDLVADHTGCHVGTVTVRPGDTEEPEPAAVSVSEQTGLRSLWTEGRHLRGALDEGVGHLPLNDRDSIALTIYDLQQGSGLPLADWLSQCSPAAPGDTEEQDAGHWPDNLAATTSPALAIHYAINAARKERGGVYLSTHMTARVLTLLEGAGWRLTRPERDTEENVQLAENLLDSAIRKMEGTGVDEGVRSFVVNAWVALRDRAKRDTEATFDPTGLIVKGLDAVVAPEQQPFVPGDTETVTLYRLAKNNRPGVYENTWETRSRFRVAERNLVSAEFTRTSSIRPALPSEGGDDAEL